MCWISALQRDKSLTAETVASGSRGLIGLVRKSPRSSSVSHFLPAETCWTSEHSLMRAVEKQASWLQTHTPLSRRRKKTVSGTLELRSDLIYQEIKKSSPFHSQSRAGESKTVSACFQTPFEITSGCSHGQARLNKTIHNAGCLDPAMLSHLPRGNIIHHPVYLFPRLLSFLHLFLHQATHATPTYNFTPLGSLRPQQNLY